MAALADQVQVELADGGQEPVRVLDRHRPGLAVVDLEVVRERQLGALDDAFEDPAGVDRLQIDGIAGCGHDLDGRGAGAERPDDDAGLGGMGAEDVVRAGMLAPDEALEIWGGG